MKTQIKTEEYVVNAIPTKSKRKIHQRIIIIAMAAAALMNTSVSSANCNNPYFKIIFMRQCNAMFYANSQFNMLPQRSQNDLNNFYSSNPNINNYTNPGQSNLSQTISIYRPFLSFGSNFAQYQQANAIPFINNTYNSFDSFVTPLLNAAGLNSLGLR
jgi:hypothetical protein